MKVVAGTPREQLIQIKLDIHCMAEKNPKSGQAFAVISPKEREQVLFWLLAPVSLDFLSKYIPREQNLFIGTQRAEICDHLIKVH